MQISVEVSPPMQREAELRGLPLGAFMQQLLELGFSAIREQATVLSAVDRIRALRHSKTSRPPTE